MFDRTPYQKGMEMLSNLPAILTATATLVAAITALVALFRHTTGPKHNTPGQHAPERKQ